ncbi:hypothetical protein M3Y96_00534200 [Aphelenchoides besseyi]|nr:hypothetical protein M3Y96_00534200 [Aphelenchoides besseyi]
MSKEWIISEPLSFWHTHGNVKKTDEFSFGFQPNVKFWIEVHTYGEDWGFFQFCSSNPLVHYEFDFYLWAEQAGSFLGGSDVVPLRFHGGHEFVHGYNPITLVCEIQYAGECPYCEIEEERGVKLPVKENAQQIDWNKKVLNLQMDDKIDKGDQSSLMLWKNSMRLISLPTQMERFKRKTAKEKENTKVWIQKMSNEDLYNKFQAQFIVLSAAQRANIIQQVEVLKNAFNSN